MTQSVRPTKKQQELLLFVAEFIAEHGYSPSYREIMTGCHYTSVATVALHVRSLIARGHLVKRGRSARSLEVVDDVVAVVDPPAVQDISEAQEKWLVRLIAAKFAQVETSLSPDLPHVDELYVLVGALKVLGLEAAAHSFMPRLQELKRRVDGAE